MVKYEYDSIILDVDGTLWDSTGIVASAWTKAIWDAAKIELEVTSDMLKGLFGRTMRIIADMLLPDEKPDKRYEIMDKCCLYEHRALEENPCRITYPGVKETIKELSGEIPLFIVSNCQSGYIELFMEKTGVRDYITDIECFGNNGNSKGDNIKLIIERNHLKKPLYVGDTKGDEDAAEYAGIPFAFASYGFGEAEHPDFVIDDFEKIKTIIKK